MAKLSAKEIYDRSEPPMVYVLEPHKAQRLNGKTMLVPSARQVAECIQGIELGKTLTIQQVRDQLAREAGAEITCPMVANKYWRIVAELELAPWWRVTVNGKPSPRMPGGIVEHRARLASEGIAI